MSSQTNDIHSQHPSQPQLHTYLNQNTTSTETPYPNGSSLVYLVNELQKSVKLCFYDLWTKFNLPSWANNTGMAAGMDEVHAQNSPRSQHLIPFSIKPPNQYILNELTPGSTIPWIPYFYDLQHLNNFNPRDSWASLSWIAVLDLQRFQPKHPNTKTPGHHFIFIKPKAPVNILLCDMQQRAISAFEPM